MAEAAQAFLASETGAGFKKINLIIQGPLNRLLGGMYDIGPIIDTVTWLSPWPDFYALGKYYGVAANSFKLISSAEKAILESSIEVCWRQQQQKNYSQAFTCYSESLDYLYRKATAADLNDVSLRPDNNDYSRVSSFFGSAEGKKLLNMSGRFDYRNGSLLVHSDLGADSTIKTNYFFKDFTDTKLLILTGEKDLIGYGQAIRQWLDSDFDFI